MIKTAHFNPITVFLKCFFYPIFGQNWNQTFELLQVSVTNMATTAYSKFSESII